MLFRISYYPGFHPEEGDTMKLIKKSSRANESELIKKKDNIRSNRVIPPLASCAYPVPKLSSSMQAERLVFLPQRSRLVVRINILASLRL